MKSKIIQLSIILITLLTTQFILAETITDGSSTFFNIEGGIKCADDKTHWIDYSSYPFPEWDSLDNCYNENGVDSKTCCPIGYGCVNDEEDGMFCQYNGKEFCSDLLTESECNLYTSDIAVNTIEKAGGVCGVDSSSLRDFEGKKCWDVIDCSCTWNNGVCKGFQHNQTYCDNAPSTPIEAGTCTWELSTWTDLCESEGIIQAGWLATGTGIYAPAENNPDCQDKDKIIPCESIVKLDFFTTSSIITVILLIILIYYFYWFKPKHKNEN